MTHNDRYGKPTIGVLAGWQFYRTATNLSYLKPIFNGINQAAHDLSCNIFFACGMGASARPEDPIRPAWPIPAPDVDTIPISPLNTDGLIVFNPLHSVTRSQYIQDLIQAGHPVLFIGSGEPGPTLVTDNSSGIFAAIQHLVDHGHRQIAFLAGSPDDMNGDTGERLVAYQSALRSFGLDNDPGRVVFGRHVYDGGYAAMCQIMDSGVIFTAVLSSNDEMALGAMKALQEAGRRIPQDVAIIGFDNRFEGAAYDPPLSSIYVPLFTMGQRGLELLIQHIEGKRELPVCTRIPARLIIRESCGCGPKQYFRVRTEAATQSADAALQNQWSSLGSTISETILSQAQSLGEDECNFLCQSLVDAFCSSVKQNDRAEFLKVLAGILERSIAGEDDASIWQDALDLIGEECANQRTSGIEHTLAQEVLDDARHVIIAHLQRQYRHYVARQRWTSSRLSLLTTSLMTALDEEQIFKTLAQYLPEMGVHQALVVLYSSEGQHPQAWSTAWNIIDLDQPPLHFPTQEFPLQGMFDQESPLTLSLIPLVHQSGQLGFAVFGTEHFDLYGAIVQQIAGALNTARLYRQAIEGRRLAEEANRMKSRFLSTISHELRTPINLIVGLSEMLLRESDESDTPLPEGTCRDIGRIHAYSQHLGGLIGDVIDLAVSDAGQLRLNFEKVDLGQALCLVAESGSQLAAEKGLSWEANFPDSGPWVWGDQTRLRQVVLNLINNAIKFTSMGGVSLRLVENSDSVSITVQDTGLGIPLDEQQAIFDEFRHSNRSLSRGYGGLGLGLAISKRLVEMHGGTITVFSPGQEGSGSTFSFTLPAVQPPMDKDQGLEKLLPAEPRVLVLTNQPSSSESLCDHLHQRGFDVQIVLIQRNFDGYSQLGIQPPETIIIDISTDHALGWQVLKEIKGNQTLSGVPVMFYSASQFEGSLIELDYITKPIEISELTKALDQHWLRVNAGGATCNILVVDDEPGTLDMHARIVQAHSASNRVLKARNGKEALDLLHQEIVDLVLLDLQMPEMDGFEVLEAMRTMESTRKIPVIVVTGKLLSEEEMERLNLGVAAVLTKGLFSFEETIGHISTALEQKRRISGEAKRLVRLAMVYLHNKYSEPISRRDIAKHIGITEDHLTFCFRQELGITPISYLQRYRINQAKLLLKESPQSITEIALIVGFSDSGYFSRIFRRETGMSPEKFRQTSL
jgi:signal transduction histidine kinase/DNA-binding LacI/PurR family transcriptional regulator/DNA-binding response OmpR family regulator